MKQIADSANQPRVIRAAAALDTKFGNPQVVAFNLASAASSERTREFWRTVARALHRPYACQSWMQDEMQTWDLIRRRQQNRTA